MNFPRFPKFQFFSFSLPLTFTFKILCWPHFVSSTRDIQVHAKLFHLEKCSIFSQIMVIFGFNIIKFPQSNFINPTWIFLHFFIVKHFYFHMWLSPAFRKPTTQISDLYQYFLLEKKDIFWSNFDNCLLVLEESFNKLFLCFSQCPSF